MRIRRDDIKGGGDNVGMKGRESKKWGRSLWRTITKGKRLEGGGKLRKKETRIRNGWII